MREREIWERKREREEKKSYRNERERDCHALGFEAREVRGSDKLIHFRLLVDFKK